MSKNKLEMKFTNEEINLSKKVAGRHIKEVKYGEWYLLNDKPILCAYANKGFHEYLEEKDAIIPIWTISDCLEFLRDRALYLLGLNQSDECEFVCGFCEVDDMGMRTIDETAKWVEGKTSLEACLKAVLAVLEEEAK